MNVRLSQVLGICALPVAGFATLAATAATVAATLKTAPFCNLDLDRKWRKKGGYKLSSDHTMNDMLSVFRNKKDSRYTSTGWSRAQLNLVTGPMATSGAATRYLDRLLMCAPTSVYIKRMNFHTKFAFSDPRVCTSRGKTFPRTFPLLAVAYQSPCVS